jgi:hypothetical protein
MKTVSIDEKSLSAYSAAQLDLDAICANLTLPDGDDATSCIQVAEHGYVLSKKFQPNDALLTISLEKEGPLFDLPQESRYEALARLIRCATMLIRGRSRSIPQAWKAYHSKNRLSFQADRYSRSSDGGRTDAGRIVLEISQQGNQRLFAFLLDRTGLRDLNAFGPNTQLLQEALEGLTKALTLSKSKGSGTEQLGNAVTLDNDLPSKVRGHLSTDDWYRSRLTQRQLQFVDHPHTGSVRLVGPAGTGKTVALAIRCLKDIETAEQLNTPIRILFLAHATATATNIENLILSMEPTKASQWLSSERPKLVISTLYALANEHMRYDLDGLTPVSLDGHEGRAFQADVLNDEIEKFKKGDWITFNAKCSEPFKAYMNSDKESTERRFFLWEVLNEFACVLDAEGVRTGAAKREQYLHEKRQKWMMQLPSRDEREVILALYDQFRATLREYRAIGGDQMVTDFINHLDSFRWEATREADGFDVVYVDELHLFNRQERMIFRNLLRFMDAAPRVFMAYDAKQSPRDTFLRLPEADSQQFDFWKDAQLGRVEKVELVDVFRYTPQIAKALASIDESFPGQEFDEEWPAYSGISKIADGPVPTICKLPSSNATYTLVFKRAAILQRELGKEGRVAVLCASNTLFKRYLDLSELRSLFVPITSREEASAIPRSTRKFVFSMPEFVAGTQFDTVLMIDVNRDEIPDGPYSTAALRKFVSQVYLGASRAERRLEFYASEDHGGIAPMFALAVLGKVVDEVLSDTLNL